jgi:dipeptidyl aminopeptidase/acylaminoacyl peptidase
MTGAVVTLITGGSSGIGAAAARRLLGQGAGAAITGRDRGRPAPADRARQGDSPLTDETPLPAPACTPGDLGRFIDLLGAALVPGADSVLYAATTRDGITACQDSMLWLADSGGARLFGDSDGAQSRPAVSADGTRAAFLQTVDGSRQLCVRPLADGGDTTVLTCFEREAGPAGPQWSPDGQSIAIDACDAPPRDQTLPYRVTQPIWRADGIGLAEDARTDIFIVPAAGGAPRRLTFDDGIVSFHAWSPDGTQILYGVWATPGSREYQIKIADCRTGAVRTVTAGPCLANTTGLAAWLPDGRIVCSSPWRINKRIDLTVLDPGTGACESRTPGVGGQLFGVLQPGFSFETLERKIVVDPAGRHAYVFIQQGGSLVTHRVALDGATAVEPITDPGSSTIPIAISGRRLLTIQTSLAVPPDLHVIDLDSGQNTPVTGLNTGWLSNPPFAVRPLTFATADQGEAEGWYLEPRTGQRPHPTVLSIHGGPFAAHGAVFSVDDLLLTAAGYGVLHINYRGSSGYGDGFAPMLIEDLNRSAPADLLHGVQAAVDRGLADTERIAAFGLSFGGYLTAWLLTHSDRFRAGIAECLHCDWAGMLGSDIPEVIAAWTNSPPGRGDKSMTPYTQMSPSAHAAACSAPLLIIEHEADLRCPPTQGDIFYNELQLAGKKTEMLRLPGVPHVPYSASLPTRIARAQAMLDWMNRHAR